MSTTLKTILLLFSFSLLWFEAFTLEKPDVVTDRYKGPRYKKAVIKERLESINDLVDFRYNKAVKRYINSYVIGGGRRTSEAILGRSAVYFPIFEYYLDLYNLPQELKFLTIIESEIKPKAVSRSGAAGLWQFMPSTARMYNLKINNYVDERFDAHKSTEAAVKLLSDLYSRYKDWELALAAYNCGTVKVNKALRQSRRKSFEAIRKKLPKETQSYVYKFMAACYLGSYYMFHDIRPNYPDYTLQLTSVYKIYNRVNLEQIAEESGIPYMIVRKLNPSFKKGIIPPNSEGYNVLLPIIGLSSTYKGQVLGMK